MAKTQKHHQAAAAKASCAGMLRSSGGVSRFYNTGVNKNAVRASAADDEIAEALEERALRKGRKS
jgi:hypothetical protein